jgi:hypothetical protein
MHTEEALHACAEIRLGVRLLRVIHEEAGAVLNHLAELVATLCMNSNTSVPLQDKMNKHESQQFNKMDCSRQRKYETQKERK